MVTARHHPQTSPSDTTRQSYLVLFERWRGTGATRLEQTRAQIAQADEHVRRLQHFIEREGLAGAVSVAGGTTIGAVGVLATPDAARRLETMEGVVRVARAP